jgi:hypothetical protein
MAISNELKKKVGEKDTSGEGLGVNDQNFQVSVSEMLLTNKNEEQHYNAIKAY